MPGVLRILLGRSSHVHWRGDGRMSGKSTGMQRAAYTTTELVRSTAVDSCGLHRRSASHHLCITSFVLVIAAILAVLLLVIIPVYWRLGKIYCLSPGSMNQHQPFDVHQ